MISEHDISLIDRHLMGELTSEEQKVFADRLNNDSDFAEEVKLQQEIMDGISAIQHNTLLQQVKNDFHQWKTEGFDTYKPSKTPKTSGSSIVVKIIIAAVIAGVAAFAIWKMTSKPDKDKPKTNMQTPQSTPPNGSTEQPLIRLKTNEAESAEIHLSDIDPYTLSVTKMEEQNGVFIYEVKHSGQVQYITSDDPELDKKLMQMAEEEIKRRESE
ncbi:MAG: hypothetical protein H6607_08175 [Flavobacteriales bacterium]|nr:hypothetical protein [Flavobacteriales bacterium]